MIKLESSITEMFDEGSYQGNWGDQGNGIYNNPVLAGMGIPEAYGLHA